MTGNRGPPGERNHLHHELLDGGERKRAAARSPHHLAGLCDPHSPWNAPAGRQDTLHVTMHERRSFPPEIDYRSWAVHVPPRALHDTFLPPLAPPCQEPGASEDVG